MGDALSNLPVGGIGAGSLVALIVLLILNGRLVTRQTLIDLRADRDKWQASSEKWQAVATQHGMTLDRLITYAEAADHALTSIQAVVQRSAEDGHR
jgi:hypothetical protein